MPHATRRLFTRGTRLEDTRVAEALRAGFEDLGLDEILSLTIPANTRSQRVMQKLGMRFDRTFDHPRYPEGHRVRPHVLYRLTRADWERRRRG